MAEIIAIAVLVFIHRILIKAFQGFRSERKGGDAQGELREAIRHERRVELGLEFDRFYDLVRWGIAKEVLQAAGKNYQDKNALLPLPQTEIDKSKGVLVQNPDYQ